MDVPRFDYWVDMLIGLPCLLAPVLAVNASSQVLEVQPLVAKLARHKVSVEDDLSDLEGLLPRRVNGKDVQNLRASFSDLHQPLHPLGTVRLLVFMAFEVARVLELPRHFHLLLAKLIAHTVCGTDVTNTSGKGSRGALGELLLDGVDEALVVFSVGVRGHEGVDTTFKGRSKKSQESVSVKLGMPKRFCDFLPSLRNLRAMEGKSPVESSVRLVVYEKRMMLWTDSSAYNPVYL